MPTRQDRIAGGLYGLLVGDALGVPYEFHDPDDLPPLYEIEMTPPAGFERAHGGTPPGTWSDDGAQALALLASLLECGRLDPEDLGQRLLAWQREGYMAVDGRVFDIGVQTAEALGYLRMAVPALTAGPDHEHANGNGSLMRVLPLALWHRGSDDDLVRDAHLQSRVTHGHFRAQACSALYCLWARRIMEEHPQPWQDAVATLERIYGPQSEDWAEVDRHICPLDSPEGDGSGYVVDCLHSARYAVEAGDYETAVKEAIALGHDTDTTACVSGGIAGLRDGIGAIPERWLTSLRGRVLVEPLLDRLLAAI